MHKGIQADTIIQKMVQICVQICQLVLSERKCARRGNFSRGLRPQLSASPSVLRAAQPKFGRPVFTTIARLCPRVEQASLLPCSHLLRVLLPAEEECFLDQKQQENTSPVQSLLCEWLHCSDTHDIAVHSTHISASCRPSNRRQLLPTTLPDPA